MKAFALLALLTCLSGCGGQLVEFPLDSGDAPTVISTLPGHAARSVGLDSSVSATFSTEMEPSTLRVTSFTLVQGSTPVAGAVTYDSETHTANFVPADELRIDRMYTATLTTEVTDTENRALEADYTWTFTTANFSVREAMVSAQSVAAPDYTFDGSELAILTDVNDIVRSATGAVTLTAGQVAGQRYVLVDAGGLDTYAELDDQYVRHTSAMLTATVPAATFRLIGEDLTTAQVRTMIIANTSSGVRSYQSFETTFHASR